MPHEAAWLTTLRGDGSPHTTPVWFVLDGETIWIASSRTNVKVRNLARDDRVSCAFGGGGSSLNVAEGRAVVHDLMASPRHQAVIDALADKYDGWDAADQAVDGPRVLIEVAVRRWLLRH